MNQLFLVPKYKTPDLRTKTGLACGRLVSSLLEQGM